VACLPLARLDTRTRDAIASLASEVDARAATALWEEALAAPPHPGPLRWLHGDLQPGNLLCHNRQLAAVIDFGLLGVGDPACDLLPAWNLFEGRARQAFREATRADEAAWTRGKGWAIYAGVIALAYYRDTEPALAAQCRWTLSRLLGD